MAARIAVERAKRPNLGNFAEELFADTFATYVGGPAYAYSCLLLRLNPTAAHGDVKPTHPASVKRAVAILTTLDALEAAHQRSGKAAGSLAPWVADLRAAWADRLRAAGVAAEPSPEAAEYAAGLATELRGPPRRPRRRCSLRRAGPGRPAADAVDEGCSTRPARSSWSTP